MVQHDDFWDTIARNVQVHRSNVRQMIASAVVLDDGTEIPTDVLLCGTGWDARYPFISEEQANALGLPCDFHQQSPEQRRMWEELTARADEQILRDFPMLATPPEPGRRQGKRTPARLWAGIASLSDPSIVFLGRVYLANSFRVAEVQAIWATAYLDGTIAQPQIDQARWEVAYMNAFSKWRYPAYGADGLFFFNDLLGYTDKLLRDVGLKSHRRDWWTDWEAPCLASDLRDTKDEYCSMQRLAHDSWSMCETVLQ